MARTSNGMKSLEISDDFEVDNGFIKKKQSKERRMTT